MELASRLSSRSGRARLRLGQGPRRSRGPVPASGRQSGPREERRRPARLPAAPENLPQGSAPRNGAASARAHCGSGRFSAASVGGLHLMPPLRSAFVPTRFAVRTHLRAPHKPAEDGGFALALVRPRLPSPFFVQNRSLWGRKWPPRLNFAQKTGSEGAARPPATRPEPFRFAKNSGPLAFGGLPARRGLVIAPVTVPIAQARSGLGSGLAALQGTGSQSPDIF